MKWRSGLLAFMVVLCAVVAWTARAAVVVDGYDDDWISPDSSETDPAGDGISPADITNSLFQYDQANDRYAFAYYLTDVMDTGYVHQMAIYIDSDADDGTGNSGDDGADFRLFWDNSTTNVELQRWYQPTYDWLYTGSNGVIAWHSNFVEWAVSRSYLDDTTNIEWFASVVTFPIADEAPDSEDQWGGGGPLDNGAIPEPVASLMLGLGGLSLAVVRRRNG